MQCFRAFHTAERTLEGVEALHMMRKGQIKRLDGRNAVGQAKFVESLFGIAACGKLSESPFLSQTISRNTTSESLFDGCTLIRFDEDLCQSTSIFIGPLESSSESRSPALDLT